MTGNDANWAWVAGIIEGEGSIIGNPGHVAIRVNMTDFDIIYRLKAIAGGYIFGPYERINENHYGRKPFMIWSVQKWSDVERIAERIKPWLGERRLAQLETMLFFSSRMGHSRIRTHCKNGHELTGDNVGLLQNGDRYCRVCGRARQAEYRARQRAAS